MTHRGRSCSTACSQTARQAPAPSARCRMWQRPRRHPPRQGGLGGHCCRPRGARDREGPGTGCGSRRPCPLDSRRRHQTWDTRHATGLLADLRPGLHSRSTGRGGRACSRRHHLTRRRGRHAPLPRLRPRPPDDPAARDGPRPRRGSLRPRLASNRYPRRASAVRPQGAAAGPQGKTDGLSRGQSVVPRNQRRQKPAANQEWKRRRFAGPRSGSGKGPGGYRATNCRPVGGLRCGN
jgi:hypothetical protein